MRQCNVGRTGLEVRRTMAQFKTTAPYVDWPIGPLTRDCGGDAVDLRITELGEHRQRQDLRREGFGDGKTAFTVPKVGHRLLPVHRMG